MLRRFLTVLLELCVLAISAVFIYLEELIRLVVPRPGKSLEGEIILVTGAGNGLGKEICKQLATSRAKLVLWDVCEEDNKKAAQELRDLGADLVMEETVDVSNRESIAAASTKLRRQVGHVTMLVNNAGICPMQQFLELTPQAIEKTFQTNVLAHFWTIKEFLPHMLEVNHGHIVTICSTMGQMAIRGPAPYYATKHAVYGYIESLKDELAHLPYKCEIKFTTAYPFFINTRMVTGNDCGLFLKFKFPSITPFMNADYVAKRIVDGVRYNTEHIYIPEKFRIYLAGKFFLPSKLHRIFVDFFVEEWRYSDSLGSKNGSTVAFADKASVEEATSPNLFNFANEFSSSPPAAWLNESTKKGK